MRTTVDIDRELLERAKKALGVRTFREAIVRSLEDATARREMRQLVDQLEGSDAVWSLEEALAYRRLERPVDLGDPT
ncbi:MAG: hypothetical protein HY701_01710 [Gemmatimonadetes bacterium]|nr:hypothetical protein [Gemmatimonadota bacterium]